MNKLLRLAAKVDERLKQFGEEIGDLGSEIGDGRERSTPLHLLSTIHNPRSTIFLRDFTDDRNRDPEGRFDSGTVARPDDFAIAMMPAPKPKMGLGKKLAIAGTAGLLGGTATGRKLVKGAAGALTRKAESYLK